MTTKRTQPRTIDDLVEMVSTGNLSLTISRASYQHDHFFVIAADASADYRSGMAHGATLDEALDKALSDLAERSAAVTAYVNGDV